MKLTKKISLSKITIGLILPLMLMFSVALAQTETSTISADIPEELVPLAKDLGCQTSAQCAEKFDANIETGIALAQKYDIYTPEQEKVAATFKTEVLERLRGVNQDNFEEEILALANKILKEKPALARTMSLTRQGVNAAETIINTVKDAGVDIATCQKSPEDLSREQLIACVKASNNLSSKGTLVGDYIPKGNAKVGEVEQMLALENSLLAGEYSELGKVSAEEAGQICLKSGSESIVDCDRIAQKFFGNEGVKHLQEARKQTTRIKEYYTEGIERMELVTPDGQKLIGKGAIRNACDRAFEDSNLGLARACGNFAVKNGYASQEEIENGLKLLESFSQKAGDVNFDDCRFNPESCREFLPDDFRSQFDSQFEIFKIMSESIGFDPARCENSYDTDIGKRCLEGAKKALSRVEEIAQKSPEARRIVDEIRGHITEGERMSERRDEFNQDSSRGGMAGPGGCRGPEECFKYCSQATNSAECISFGAKSQIFDQNTVAQKFNMINERNDKFDYRAFPNIPDSSGQFRQEVDPGFNRYPYPSERPDQGFNRYPYPEQPAGPSPECFAAISSGDFAKAKTACASTTENYPKPIAEPFPVCPSYSMPSPCPEGQMRQAATDVKGCVAYGACTVIEGYKPIDTPKPCPVGTYWDGRSCVANPEQKPITTCSSGQWWDGATQSCRFSTVPTVGSCDYSTQYWKASTSQCQPRTNCYNTANAEYNSQECQGVRGATQPVSSGCGSMTTQASCQASPGCGWANGACGGNMTTGGYGCGGYASQTSCSTAPGCSWQNNACMPTSYSTTCSAGQYWYTPPGGGAGYCTGNPSASGACPAGYHPHSESGGFCMNDQENYSGTCYNSSGTSTMTCPQQTYTATTCASGQYWNGSACVTSTTSSSDMLAGCTQAGGAWNTSSNYCQMPTCSSGQYWYVPPSGGAGYCMTTSTTNCTSGQYWNGTACVSSSTTTTDSTAMSTACAVAGGTWSSSSNYCQMPTTTTGSASCASGQYWNGSACVNSSTSGSSSCTSGQYWNGSACVSSSTTSSSSDMSSACASAGGTWNSGSNYCQMPTTSGASSCTSGQYWDGSACVSSSNTTSSSSTSSNSDMSSACAQAGGSWNGSSCIMPTTTNTTTTTPTPEPTPTTSDPATMCAQSGGTWTGSTCQMAKNISDQKAYLSYFQKDSDGLLAQAFGAFADLFK